MQTTASTPKLLTERVRAEDTHMPCIHKRCRDALEFPLSFKLTTVMIVTAVVALALLLQA